MAANGETAAQSFARRDQLLALQAAAQAKWEAARAFEADAPTDDPAAAAAADKAGKFFGTFPYPYMNGLLHLGHAFSLSKLEFAAAYHRLRGRRVLFPQGFHCTGMPIKACADRLAREMEQYGCPPVFPGDADGDGGGGGGGGEGGAAEAEAAAAAEASAAADRDPSKFASKKSKAAAKKGGGASQWDILRMSGIPEGEVPAFADPAHWLAHFPPLAARDMRALGCGVDWRRAFITTDANPFYDAFVRWQFNTLRARGVVVKDKRYAVFSPLDGQPCADHDRATGEGVGPQDYTLVKMRALLDAAAAEGAAPRAVAALAPAAAACPAGVFLLAATLRPETMAGQTNAWALPDGEYVAVRGLAGEAYVCTRRAARNLAYQDRLPAWGAPEVLAVVSGADLLGLPLDSPRAPGGAPLRVLPLLTILTSKGTGIVTSVPSDSPDDYAALADLKSKPKLREKFGLRDEWVEGLEVVPIIDIPGLGDRAAETVCKQMKIGSQNDAKKLAEAKAAVYLRGFTDGVLLVGPHAGKKVSDAKPLIRAELLAEGGALPYSEPERLVVSRSGDECVVALTDQWYITYGEEAWREATRGALARMECFDDAARHAFEHTLGWLSQWACSRSFGLGSRLPWDPAYLVESLSDSTVYMAYYAVAHVLQGGDMYAAAGAAPPGPGGAWPAFAAADVTDAVFDHVFLGAPAPQPCGVPAAALRRMRAEFEYWYPMDLRVSGKDLIQNHLTFCLYTHVAVWADGAAARWPRAMRCNGHLLLNADKMSKSTGNFKTLAEAVAEYSADACRAALADAGDALDDANFESSTANGAILKLTKELAWAEEALAAAPRCRDEDPRDASACAAPFLDAAFDNEIDAAVAAAGAAYEACRFRDALKAAWYDLTNARDVYRFGLGPEGPNRRLLLRYLDVQWRLLAPICPHAAEHVWSALLQRPGLVVAAGWPAAPPPDPVLSLQARYVEDAIAGLRRAVAKAEAPPKARKGGDGAPPARARVAAVELAVAERYGGWQAAVLALLRGAWRPGGGDGLPAAGGGGAPAAAAAAALAAFFPADLMARVLAATKPGGDPALAALDAKTVKAVAMPFAKRKADEAAAARSDAALQDRLPFDEAALLEAAGGYISRSLGGLPVRVRRLAAGEGDAEGADPRLAGAAPGAPAALLTTEERA